MIKFVKKILNFGIEEGQISISEKHSVHLINLICICIITANFLLVLATIHIVDWNLVINNVFENIVFSIIIFLNYKQKIKIAKWVFIAILLLILIYVPFLVPHSLNADGLYLVIIVIFGAILNDTKTMLTLTLLVLTLLIGWHLFNYYSLINPLNDFKENEIIFMEINYTIIMVIFVVIPLLSYRKITTDYQKELSDNVLEKEMLLKEIHHRVKNNLQLIISMLGLQENKALFLESKEMIKDLKARVISMAIIHRKLYQKDGVSTLNLEEYIRQLTDLLIETYKEEKTQLEKTIDIEPITVGLELSIPLGLIITEVISNSFKHAFKLNKTSYLEIIGYKTTHGFFILKIKDNGMGLPLDTDQIDSLGFSLIKMLCNQIEAKLERLNNQGLETTITFKL